MILKKVENFQVPRKISTRENNPKNDSRRLRMKTEDFQRVRLGGKGLGKRELTFTWRDVVDKFGWETTCYLTGKPLNLREPRTYHFDHKIVKEGPATSKT